MRCKICGQSGVDGAYDQYGDFVCVDCWADGEAYMEGRHAEILSPVPGFDYSGLDTKKILHAFNHEEDNGSIETEKEEKE